MCAVHTLIAEVLANLVHALKSAHDKALQIKLGGDAHVHVCAQRVEVCDEGACGCTAGNALQGGSLHFGVSRFVQDVAHGAQDGGALQEGFLHAGVYNEVHITLAVSQFGVIERVIYLSVLLLYHGQRLQTLGQHGHVHGMDGDLSGLGAEYIALDADEVAQVEALLEHDIVKCGVFGVGTKGVTGDVHLDAAFAVQQFHECGLALHTLAHDASGHTNHPAVFGGCGSGHLFALLILDGGQVHKILFDFCAESVCGVFCCGIGVNS